MSQDRTRKWKSHTDECLRWATAAVVVAVLLNLPAVGMPWSVAGANAPRVSQPVQAASTGAPLGPWTGHVGARPAAGAGSILDTVDLADNRSLYGNAQPAAQDLPVSAVFDPGASSLFVRGDLGNSISVVNTTTETLVATINGWFAQNPYQVVPAMAVDPTNGQLWATNAQGSNISVVSPSALGIVTSIYVGGSPGAIAFDPTDGDFYVANGGGNNVTVVSAATHRSVASIPVGTHPSDVLYDPASNQLFVSNFNSGNVSVIDGATGKVVANLPAGTYPVNLALDTVGDEVFVANSNNGGPSNVTVVAAASDTVRMRVGVGSGPIGFAFYPAREWMYVANDASGNVSVVNGSTGAVVASVATGSGPYVLVYNAVDGNVYVANSQTPNVTILHAASHRIVGGLATDNGYLYGLAQDPASGDVFAVSEGTFTTGGPPPHAQSNVSVIAPTTGVGLASVPLNVYPTGLVDDPANGLMFAADPGGNDLYGIDPATGTVAAIVPAGSAPETMAYDPVTGDLWVVDRGSESITVLDAALQPVATVGTGYGPTAIVYDAADREMYVTDDLGGNVSVLNATTHAVVASVVVQPFGNLVAEVYDPHDHEVYVADYSANNVTAIRGVAPVASIRVGSSPSSLAFDAANDTVFVANSVSANVSVIADSTDRVAATFSVFSAGPIVDDPANGAVYVAGTGDDVVTVVNASSYSLLGHLATGTAFGPAAGTFDAATSEVGFSTEFAGSVSLIGSGGPPSRTTVTFVETGLPFGRAWSVTLNGAFNSSTGASIGFLAANGTFGYVVGPVAGYQSNVTGGNVLVAGIPRTVDIGFTTNGSGSTLYNVSFVAHGLPASTNWSVSLDGLPRSSSSTSIAFREGNGTYPFLVASAGSYSPVPASGNVPVAGASVTVNITFRSGGGSLQVRLVADPATLVLGGRTNLTTSVVLGGGSLTYVYSSLPAGCVSGDQATLPCTPTATGTFDIVVNVTDASNDRGSANTTLIVQPRASTVGAGSSSVSTSWLLLILVLVLVVIAILIAVLRSRRRAPPPPTPPAGAPPPTK